MMNERIKELSIKAGFPEWSNHAIEFELEKFAELIVEECYRVVVSNPHIGTSLAGANMKKHFGMDNNIAAAERIHSDKGYSLGTPEAQEAFDSKRGYNYD
jgi:hypothetical protein